MKHTTNSLPTAIRVLEFSQAIRYTHQFWARFEYNGQMLHLQLEMPEALACLWSAGYDEAINVKDHQAQADILDYLLDNEKTVGHLLAQAMRDKALASQAEAVFYDITSQPAPAAVYAITF